MAHRFKLNLNHRCGTFEALNTHETLFLFLRDLVVFVTDNNFYMKLRCQKFLFRSSGRSGDGTER
jgi:hypothetical protein